MWSLVRNHNCTFKRLLKRMNIRKLQHSSHHYILYPVYKFVELAKFILECFTSASLSKHQLVHMLQKLNFIPFKTNCAARFQVSTMYCGTSDQYGYPLGVRHFMTKPSTFKYPQNMSHYTVCRPLVNSGY